MTFKVSRITGEPRYDSLPVAKITDYPLEPRDYKPFAQVSMCVSERFLHLRMWAFEVNPQPESGLEAVLYLFRQRPDTALAVAAVSDDAENGMLLGVLLLKDGEEQATPKHIEQRFSEIALHPYNGEDLQGVYWGYTVDIPLSLLEEWGGDLLINPGDSFPGNFFKICDTEPRPHCGSFFPADFVGNCYLPSSCGTMEIVTY